MNILFILDHQKASGGHVQGLNYHRIFQKFLEIA